ncbi:MAG: hypothetical protein IT584_02935, partial [Chlamydiae bacterium]|nr:hypothetical protein [Chlamydiota bacterium]
ISAIVREVFEETGFRLDENQVHHIGKVYRAPVGFVNLGLARQRKIDLNERDHCTLCKTSEEDRFYKAVASPNSQNLTARGIYILVPNFDLRDVRVSEAENRT